MYGDGVYFTADAFVSSKNALPDENGYRYMFYCSVLTGEYTMGKQGLKSPPIKDTETQDCYDSVCDNITRPTIFVIFNDCSVYPTYLIIFRRRSTDPCPTINWWEPRNKMQCKFFWNVFKFGFRSHTLLDFDHICHKPINFINGKFISKATYAVKLETM